ncbi:MAG: hypothetical protein ACYC1M_05235 [Armatimonadota bacterium]
MPIIFNYGNLGTRLTANFQTIDHMVNYVLWTWEHLQTNQTDHVVGFSGLLYITLASYIERYLKLINVVRISLYLNVRPSGFGMVDSNICGKALGQVDYSVYNNITHNITSAYLTKVEKMTKQRLCEEYKKLYFDEVKNVIGGDLYDDWTALADIRNKFAHGQSMPCEIDITSKQVVSDTYSDTASAQRLITNGTIPNSGGPYYLYLFHNTLMHHYYSSTQAIIQLLDGSVTNLAERQVFTSQMHPLLPNFNLGNDGLMHRF